MEFKRKCIEYKDNRKRVVCEENQRQITFVNKDEIEATKLHVDGCQIDDDGVRCDYLVVSEKGENYIELKGSDINHAVKQITRTIQSLSQNPKEASKRSFVISTRCPLSSAEIQVIEKKDGTAIQDLFFA